MKKVGLCACGYFVHLQDILISFIGYFIHELGCPFSPCKSNKHFLKWFIMQEFFMACAPPYRSLLLRHMQHMREPLPPWMADFCGVRISKQTGTLLCELFFLCLSFWRIVHWIKSGILGTLCVFFDLTYLDFSRIFFSCTFGGTVSI